MSRPEHRIDGWLISELVSADLDDALGPLEKQALNAHLATCPGCRRIADTYLRANELLRSRLADSEIEGARRESLRRLRENQTRRCPTGGIRWEPALAFAVLVVIVTVTAILRSAVANPAVPESEVIFDQVTDLPDAGGAVELTVEQGHRAARPGANIGVVAHADARLTSAARRGLLEIRLQEAGDAYGVLARADNLAGARLLRLEGSLPELQRGEIRTYTLWIHLEVDGITAETPAVTLQLQAVAGGERATIR